MTKRAQPKIPFDDPTGSPGQHRRGFMKGAVLTAIAPLAMAQEVRLTSNANPFVGIWKLNVAKSKFDPGPPVRSRTETMELVGDALKTTVEQVDADGNYANVVETAKFDGKDYPRTATGALAASGADTLALKRIDAYTVEASVKKHGDLVTLIRQVVSKDGETKTATYLKGTNAQGQAVRNVLVFDRQ